MQNIIASLNTFILIFQRTHSLAYESVNIYTYSAILYRTNGYFNSLQQNLHINEISAYNSLKHTI